MTSSRGQQQKLIEHDGRQFQINKFTPADACYWASQALGELMGGLSNTKIEGKSFMQKLPAALASFLKMDRDKYEALQKDCLAVVFEKAEAGWFPVTDPHGNVTAVMDAPLMMKLTTEAFMFTVSDFLDQSLLDGVKTSALEAAQSATTQTETSTTG